jgi:hypothetical protein
MKLCSIYSSSSHHLALIAQVVVGGGYMAVVQGRISRAAEDIRGGRAEPPPLVPRAMARIHKGG